MAKGTPFLAFKGKNLPSPGVLEAIAKASRKGSYVYLQEMFKLLQDDSERVFTLCLAEKKRAEELEPAESDEFYLILAAAYRTYIRSFFANVEGLTWVMRRVALWAHQRGEIQLEPDHLQRLEREEQGKFGDALTMFNLTFKVFPLIYHSTFPLPKDGEPGWSAFCRLWKVRDDITHPKDPITFRLSPRAFVDVLPTTQWFFGVMSALIQAWLDTGEFAGP
jgi:hypothetical protein